ncbi:hypothetical protein SLA2020_309810 [Shorea laevis]
MMQMENSSPMTVSGEASASSSGNQIQAPQPKKKRNLPGMPDPDAEVIALSPESLLATNRFVCEICNKGFQRDQNLQLHRRGHNLPWKLRQRTSKEIRKRVYVCPEPTCVHHNPSRALGDLTGVKKHFCRKHGEKKWQCERCSKKYAVQSDWKAHLKTCGTREYKCDCGTIFSRRDSFVTHRAFCDALAEATAKAKPLPIKSGTAAYQEDTKTTVKNTVNTTTSPPPLTPSSSAVSPGLSIQSPEIPDNPVGVSPPTPAAASTTSSFGSSGTAFTTIFAANPRRSSEMPPPTEPLVLQSATASGRTSLSLSSPLYLSSNGYSLFPTRDNDHCQYAHPQPAMSATALLQKAAQMGATSSNPSLLRGLGLAVSSASSAGLDANVKLESNSMADSLGLGLPSFESSCFTDSMGSSALFGNKQRTLDLLGLGIGAGDASTSGLSALLTSFGRGGLAATSYGVAGGSSAGETWETEVRKHNGP